MIRIAIWGYSEAVGGIERLVFNYYQNMDRTKIQFDFLVAHDCGKIAYENEIVFLGGRIYRILYSEKESFIKSRMCWLEYFREHPEVVGVHVHANFPYAFPLIMAKRAGIKLRILHSHNNNASQSYGTILNWLRKRKVAHEINSAPTMYLAGAEEAAEYMFPNKKYRLIKNGIDIQKYMFQREVRTRYRKKIGVDEADVVIGMVSHLTKVKNPLYSIDIFFEYMKYNSNTKLVILGVGPLKEEMEIKIEQYGLGNNVVFVGLVEDTSVWYQAMDILLFPSLFEGFPMTLVEAQVSGLPCLVSERVPGSTNITGLVSFKDINLNPDEWAIEIEKILSKRKSTRRSYTEEMVKSGFDIKNVVRELEKIYYSSNK